jgi:hypothetical protein
MWKNDPNTRTNFSSSSGASAPPSQSSFGRQQQPGSSQSSGNSRTEDNKPPMANTQNRFPSTNYDHPQSSSEPKRPFSKEIKD